MHRGRLFLALGLAFGLVIALHGCSPTPPGSPAVGAGANWSHYLGHPTSNQYSILDQINTENVGQLEVAWTYATGDSAEYQANNLIVEGLLYTVTPTGTIMALDAATGEHRWTFDPASEEAAVFRGARGSAA